MGDTSIELFSGVLLSLLIRAELMKFLPVSAPLTTSKLWRVPVKVLSGLRNWETFKST